MKMKRVMLIAVAAASIMGVKAKAQQLAPVSKSHSKKTNHETELKQFLDKNATVADVNWKRHDTIVIKSKNGVVENYDLRNSAERKSFEDKYGTPPVASPPPPPPPPSRVPPPPPPLQPE